MNNSEGKTRSHLDILLERESISHNERLACLSHHLKDEAREKKVVIRDLKR